MEFVVVVVMVVEIVVELLVVVVTVVVPVVVGVVNVDVIVDVTISSHNSPVKPGRHKQSASPLPDSVPESSTAIQTPPFRQRHASGVVVIVVVTVVVVVIVDVDVVTAGDGWILDDFIVANDE